MGSGPCHPRWRLTLAGLRQYIQVVADLHLHIENGLRKDAVRQIRTSWEFNARMSCLPDRLLAILNVPDIDTPSVSMSRARFGMLGWIRTVKTTLPIKCLGCFRGGKIEWLPSPDSNQGPID